MKILVKTDGGFGPLFVRLGLAAVIFPHGAQKVLGWFGGQGYEKTVEVFTKQLGFPLWAVILLLVVEFIGPIGIAAGFLTRIWALGLTISMSICVYMNHWQHGFFLNWFGNQKGEGFEYHILVVGMTLSLIVSGAGKLSLDRAMTTRGGGSA